MPSISFFEPITFDSYHKPASQKLLEAVDEYFYLGGRFRVTIFTPDGQHPQAQAVYNRQGRHRSWVNIALKVASYCTIILPLYALVVKAALRFYWQISSVKLQAAPAPSSTFEARVPRVALNHIASFLDYREQGRLAQAACFTRDTTRDMYINPTASLKAEIESLPAGNIAPTALQPLLVKLVTSSAFGHPRYWRPLLEVLLLRAPGNTWIEKHALFADLLATSKKTLSPDQIYRFCDYLAGEKLLLNQTPLIGYRVLEKYLEGPNLNPVRVRDILKKYLAKQAEEIRPRDVPIPLSNRRMLTYRFIWIDSSLWFGGLNNRYSLWRQPAGNDEVDPMPPLFAEVLGERILSLQASCLYNPLEVMIPRSSDELPPRNFVLALAQRMTNAGIFLYHDNLNPDLLENPAYASAIVELDDARLEDLAQQYPNAVSELPAQ